MRSLALTIVVMSLGSTALAVDCTWMGNVSTDWNDPANWANGVVPSKTSFDDIAVFSVMGTYQPNAPGGWAEKIGGYRFLTSGWTLTTGGYGFQIGSSGIESYGAGTNTISTGFVIDFGQPAQIRVGAGDTLNLPTFWSGYTCPGTTITKTGAGVIQFGGGGYANTTWVVAEGPGIWAGHSDNLTIGTAAGPAAFVTGSANSKGTFTVNASGTFDNAGNGGWGNLSVLIVRGGTFTNSEAGTSGGAYLGLHYSMGQPDWSPGSPGLTMAGGSVDNSSSTIWMFWRGQVVGEAAATTAYIKSPLFCYRYTDPGYSDPAGEWVFNIARGTAGVDMVATKSVWANPDHTFVKDGTGILALNADWNFTNPSVVRGGTLLLNGSTTGMSSMSVAGPAKVGGVGTIGLAAGMSLTVNAGAALAPGNIDAATGKHIYGPLTVSGGTSIFFTGTAASPSALAINIGAPGAIDHDQLVTDCAVNLTGGDGLAKTNLNVSLLGGYVPTAADTFTIVNNIGTGPISGTFANVTGGKVSFTGGTFDVSYTGGDGNDVVLSNFAAAITLLPGDANKDGKVSFADYILLANNFGQTGATWDMGDFNGDGKVSFADYILLANNFGQHVPEPATLGLLLIGGLGLIRRNRK